MEIATNIICDEEETLKEEDYSKYFSWHFNDTIKTRGTNYYHFNKVISVYKNGNKYYAQVLGNSPNPYNVKLEITEDDIKYDCDCKCPYPCKHEYAVLLAISNKEYTLVELKEEKFEKEVNLKSIIELIPAEELKSYLLVQNSLDKNLIEITSFKEYFRKYYPKEEYEYYYNNLFNALIINKDYQGLLKEYLGKVKKYISSLEFKEVIKILKAIINAYKDTNRLNFDDNFIDVLPNIGMYLRVSYRKSDYLLKKEIDDWLDELKQENYYNNYYLEDVVLSVYGK